MPVVIVALLAIVALGTSKLTVISVIGLSFSPIIARTVRSAVLSERELDYVAAAKLRRENALHVMFVEILPNVLPPILVEATVRLGYAIFAVATLSFMGFGIQPPSPDWGLSVSNNYGMIGGGFWWNTSRGASSEGKPAQTNALAALFFGRLYATTGDESYRSWLLRTLLWMDTILYDPAKHLYHWSVSYQDLANKTGAVINKRFFGLAWGAGSGRQSQSCCVWW